MCSCALPCAHCQHQKREVSMADDPIPLCCQTLGVTLAAVAFTCVNMYDRNSIAESCTVPTPISCLALAVRADNLCFSIHRGPGDCCSAPIAQDQAPVCCAGSSRRPSIWLGQAAQAQSWWTCPRMFNSSWQCLTGALLWPSQAT